MRKLLGLAILAGLLALPAAPAAAQGLSFGFGFGSPGFYNDFGYRPHYRPYYRPLYRPYYRSYVRPRVYLDVDVDRGDDHVARCEARYRSYDPDTDMFLGYDGDYHYCRL
jgi:hypothetical protein